VTRNSNAVYFLPSRDEWSKAGYYQPASSGGDTDGYWNYPTRTNMLPVGEAPAGGVNSVNTQGPNGFALTKSFDFDNNQNYLTDVGAYVSASSYYGTFDQGGNVAEWTEQILSGLYRAYRGGSWLLEANSTGIIVDGVGAPGVALATVGFRMASIPEPSGIVSCVVVFGSVLGLRRSSRKASHFRAVLKFS
jgi:formylglycine-generating enzyme required for sulfatase activity